MNNTLKVNDLDVFDEDEIFDDSVLLANLENSAFKDNSFIDKNANKSLLNVSALCCDEEISGYDRLTGKTWIYPTNYPVRDYQFNIIKAAIVKNTLVSLPTGLGKTFIAAVIMYNFYRWYPLGKIVFTAPTRPLVAQQIEACYNIVALPSKDTIEMTGHMQVNIRKQHWQTKRVFFATPQVIYNDIKSGICPGDQLRCLVVDEAHRARGNYAYCQIVSTLSEMGHKTYRMLALSATPGSKVEDVVNVVRNLNIAHLELRTENCIDVAPYSHSRKINTVIIPLGPELTHLRQQYVEILDGYARRLKQFNILPHNLGNLSKGRIVMLYKEFQTKERGARHPQHNIIMKDFTLLIALYHGLELLLKHGSRVFLNFFDEHHEKSWIQADDQLTALLERLRDDLGINPLSLDRSMLPDGTVPEMPKNLYFGHPKFYKLKEIMLDHFQRAKEKGIDTRAIVFCEYRESVNLVHCLLLQCRPLIAPLMFVGQGASGKDGKTVVSQKQQLRVMRSFREGTCNALVCTCVAEEGLDVGSVDLILCFDISTRSPVRLVQRCGRTGRERGGQVHILVTEGREHQTLIDCMRQRDGLNNKVLHSKEVENNLYKLNPRMIPHDFMPDCQKMHITVPKKLDGKEKDDKPKKGQKDLRSMLQGRPSTSAVRGAEDLISEDEFNEVFPKGFDSVQRLSEAREYWAINKDAAINLSKQEDTNVKLYSWREWQRSLQKTIKIGHSTDTEILTSVLKHSDEKRFDAAPSTQNPSFKTQDVQIENVVKAISPVKPKQNKKKVKPSLVKSPIKKDGDIRALFSTTTKSTKDYTKLLNDLGISNDGKLPTSLINLLVDLNLEVTNSPNKCYICTNICDCKVFKSLKDKQMFKPVLLPNSGPLNLPDIDLIDDININSILKCSKVHTKDTSELNCSANGGNDLNQSKNFNLEFDFNLSNSPKEEVKSASNNLEHNFDIGNIEDIFESSSPEEAIDTVINSKKTEDPKETLGFFGLDSIDDIFADSDDDLNIEKQANIANKNVNEKCIVSEVEISSDDDKVACNEIVNKPDIKEKPRHTVKSPSILSGRLQSDFPTSPILCSQPRKFQLSTKKNKVNSSTPVSNVKKKLILEPESAERNKKILKKETSNVSKSDTIGNISEISSNKSMFTITQLVEMINKSDNNNSTVKKLEVQTGINRRERSLSPILLTQADRKSFNSVVKPNNSMTQNSKPESLIILESDSDSNDKTQEYEEQDLVKISNDSLTVKQRSPNCDIIINNQMRSNIALICNDIFEKEDLKEASNYNASVTQQTSPKTPKRKLEDDDDLVASPYFNKKQKLEPSTTSLSLREKVLAALSSNKFNTDFNEDKHVNFVSHSPKYFSQKENQNPIHEPCKKHNSDEKDKKAINNNIHDMLQIFRKDSKVTPRKINFLARSKRYSQGNGVLDDSDDDFVGNDKKTRSQGSSYKNGSTRQNTHKVRKKRQPNEFLDLEAELSSEAGSGDELSDDSAGSLAEFIDDAASSPPARDERALYLQSVRSPVNGVFKIPQLPKKFNNEEIFSQFVEEDNYEMDSFCVDSHIGLTQANDISELELAEMLLEEKRRKRKLPRNEVELNTTDSPLVRKKRTKCRRQIDSDSGDSS